MSLVQSFELFFSNSSFPLQSVNQISILSFYSFVYSFSSLLSLRIILIYSLIFILLFYHLNNFLYFLHHAFITFIVQLIFFS